MIADNLSKAGWSCCCCCNSWIPTGETIFVADAHRAEVSPSCCYLGARRDNNSSYIRARICRTRLPFVRYIVCGLEEAVKAIKFSTVLKWVGYATAILSFFFGVRELIKIVSDRLESRHEVGALLSSADVELRGKDYSSAWRTLEQASKLQPNSAKVRLAQENLAMKWLEDTHLRENERFSDIGDKLEPVLTRGLSSTKDAQRTCLRTSGGLTSCVHVTVPWVWILSVPIPKRNPWIPTIPLLRPCGDTGYYGIMAS